MNLHLETFNLMSGAEDGETCPEPANQATGSNSAPSPKDVKAVSTPCGLLPNYKGEVYFFAEPQTSSAQNDEASSRDSLAGLHVFWVLRWIIDYLGSASARNFVGISAPNWRARIANCLAQLGREDESEAHLQDSSWSYMKQQEHEKKKKNESTAEDSVDCQDYCISTFGLLCLLVHWAQRGPRQNASWKLSVQDFKVRCSALLLGLLSFVLPQSAEKQDEFPIRITKNAEGQPLLHIPSLCGTKSTKVLQKAFPEQEWFPFDQALKKLEEDECNKNYSAARRECAASSKARLFLFVTQQVEASKNASMWEQTQLQQLEQLRAGFAVFLLNIECLFCFLSRFLPLGHGLPGLAFGW